MIRRTRSWLLLGAVVLTAAVLVGCGSDEPKAGSDRRERRASGVLDVRLCLVNRTGEQMTVQFNEASTKVPLGAASACTSFSSSEMAYVTSSFDPVILLTATNPSDIPPRLLMEIPTNTSLRNPATTFRGTGTLVFGPVGGSPYRFTATRLPDSTSFKEIEVVIER